jgi:hypothetical protein
VLSPFHFNRLLRAGIGESPAAFRRRLLLERAAWRLSRCASVIDVVYDIEAKQNGWSFRLERTGCAQCPVLSQWQSSPSFVFRQEDVTLTHQVSDRSALLIRADQLRLAEHVPLHRIQKLGLGRAAEIGQHCVERIKLTQCTHVIFGACGSGASGSSTMITKLLVADGSPSHRSSGELSSPSQV